MNVHATLAETGARPRLLVCPPRHFAVTYSINPWMDPRAWAGDGQLHADAERQWTALRGALINAGRRWRRWSPQPIGRIWYSRPMPPWCLIARPFCRAFAIPNGATRNRSSRPPLLRWRNAVYWMRFRHFRTA